MGAFWTAKAAKFLYVDKTDQTVQMPDLRLRWLNMSDVAFSHVMAHVAVTMLSIFCYQDLPNYAELALLPKLFGPVNFQIVSD